MGWFGTYAYIFLEVGGEDIPDGSVVTTHAHIFDVNYYDYKKNRTHIARGDFETAECRVIFDKSRA